MATNGAFAERVQRLLESYRSRVETRKRMDDEFLRGWDAARAMILEVFGVVKESLRHEPSWSVALSSVADTDVASLSMSLQTESRVAALLYKRDLVQRQVLVTQKVNGDETESRTLPLSDVTRETVENQADTFLRRVLQV